LIGFATSSFLPTARALDGDHTVRAAAFCVNTAILASFTAFKSSFTGFTIA
jgi:hypothetical protein